jgi:hypothetical protein
MAEGLGIQKQETPNGRMHGQPLMPKKCSECGTVNNCLKDSCTSCQTRLPENTLPEPDLHIDDTEEEREKQRIIGEMKSLKSTLKTIGIDVDEL